MENAKINQKEYLRKYLSGSDGTKKKKKKRTKVGVKKVKIIDDDVDLKNLRPLEDGEFDILNSTEDAPQIAGIVDERGPVDFTDKRRWKIIADDGEGNIAISSSNNRQNNINNEDILNGTTVNSSRKSSSKSTKKNPIYNNNDQSLPRKLKKHSDNNLSPPRKSLSKKSSKKRRRKVSSSSSDSSSDSSTTSSSSNSTHKKKLKSKKRSAEAETSARYDSDLSPPRPARKHVNDEREYSRRQDVDSDLSPPRKSLKHSYEKNRERDNRHSRHNGSDNDLSPPRKSSGNMSRKFKINSGDDSDLSPPRRSQTNSRHAQHHDSSRNFDASRRDRDKSSRHYRKSRWADESRRSQSPQIDRRMKKTLDGKMAGLQDAAALKEETAAHKKRESEFFNQLSADVSGVGQAAVLRDRKTGRRRNLDAEAAVQREKDKRQEEIDAKYAKWGRGLKQVDDQTEKLKQDLYEMSKPLARYANDADLDAQLRATEREGDPMLEYIKQKQIKEGKREPDRPNYQGSYMPNRFGIKPGHRWDGVDRSSGYEKKWFEARNARTAVQEEAYKWSTADM